MKQSNDDDISPQCSSDSSTRQNCIPEPVLSDNQSSWILSETTPAVFMGALKAAYADGKERAGKKFQALRMLVTTSLLTAPPPGPSTFIVKCLESLLTMEPPFNEGLSHLLTSAINHVDASYKSDEDVKYSRRLAASMFKDAVSGITYLDARILVRLVVVFGIQLQDVGEAATTRDATEEDMIQEAKKLVAPFIFSLVKERAYTSAVALLKQFDLQDCTPQNFLTTMVTDGEPDLAAQWAAHMGIDMCCYLVQQCSEMGLYKVAHRLVQRYKLEEKFPDSYILYKKSSLRKLVGRGLWDVAESVALTAPVLQEYLVALAIEEGDASLAAEYCEKFNLEQLSICDVIVDPLVKNQYVKLSDVMPSDKVFWVDSAESLAEAKEHLRHATVVGLDSEWKANHVKGSPENKVAILQLATAERAFVFDMLNLSEKEPEALDNCLKIVFPEPGVLKLGYAVNNDIDRLAYSYGALECFSVCESLLDLQVFAEQAKGGLSGLTKLALGGYLDKSARMSDWEKRPLTEKQLHYAALDAAVLISVFRYLEAAPDVNGHPVTRDYRPYLKSFRLRRNWSGVCHPQSHVTNFSDDTGSSNGAHAAERMIMDDEEDLKLVVNCSSEESTAAVSQTRGGITNLHEDKSVLDRFKGAHEGYHDATSEGRMFGEGSTEDKQQSADLSASFHSGSAVNLTVSDMTVKSDPFVDKTLDATRTALEGSHFDQISLELFDLKRKNDISTAMDDLVCATYELLGQPTPGLLKSRLQEFTQAAGLPLPLYQAEAYGPDHLRSFRCSVAVGNFRFWGQTAFKKRAAELMAAQSALSFFLTEWCERTAEEPEKSSENFAWTRSKQSTCQLDQPRGQTSLAASGGVLDKISSLTLKASETGHHWRFNARVSPFWSLKFAGPGRCSVALSRSGRLSYKTSIGSCGMHSRSILFGQPIIHRYKFVG